MPPEVMSEPTPCSPRAADGDRILIIDNDAALVSALSAGLEREGFQVCVAETGQQGRAAAHREHPDLIILDQRLPDTDGLTLCQELADAPETSGVPSIMLSGMVRPDIIRRPRAAGGQYFVRKPYDPSALLVLIRHSIDEARRCHQPA